MSTIMKLKLKLAGKILAFVVFLGLEYWAGGKVGGFFGNWIGNSILELDAAKKD